MSSKLKKTFSLRNREIHFAKKGTMGIAWRPRKAGVTADLDPFSRIWTSLQNVIVQRKKDVSYERCLELFIFTSFASLSKPSKCRLTDWLAHASGKIWTCLDPLHCERPFVPVPNLTHSKNRGKVLMGGVKIIIGNGTVAISMNLNFLFSFSFSAVSVSCVLFLVSLRPVGHQRSPNFLFSFSAASVSIVSCDFGFTETH